MSISHWSEIKEGNLILKAQGSEHIKIWSVYQVGNAEKWTQIIGAGSAAQKEWTPGQGLPKELWIEGYKGSDSERDVTLELWYDADAADVRYTEYDKANRVTKTWVNNHPATEYSYNATGNVLSVTDPVLVVTASEYDNENRLVQTTVDTSPGGLQEKTRIVYDKAGRQTQVTQAYLSGLDTTTYSFYDNANRLITQYTSNPTYATNYTYYKTGQVKTVTDAENNTTTNYYDKGGRLIGTQDARLKTVTYAYDKDGLRTKVTYKRSDSGNDIDTTYTYYLNHLLWTTDLPGFSGRNVTTNVYDGNGNLTGKTDAKGQTISYTFDLNNRLTGKTSSVESVAYTYDAESNLLTVQDANSNTVNIYDDLNRLITQTQTSGTLSKTIGYGYYEDGLRQTMLDPEGNNIGYTYDKAKRLLTVTRNSVTEATYLYNPLGLRTRLTYGNGAYAEYEYNHPLKWLTALRNKKADGITILSSFVYTHDKVGNRKTMTLSDGSVVSYGYDFTYQLISEVRTVHAAYQLAWGYDNVGNRITQTRNALLTLYNYNDANQLTQEITGSTTTTCQYDQNGNLTVKTDPTGTTTFGYDYENRQTSFDAPGTANDASYVYDATEVRISKTVGGVTEKYVLDGANVIADYDGSNILKASYVTPFLDQNLLTVQVNDKWYYMQDGLGSVRNIMKGNSEKKSYDYYGFGEMRDEKTFGNLQGFYNRYKFTSREWDAESVNYYYRARYYSPTSGRFTARDPIEYEGGLNLYNYVGNNPIMRTDPTGERSLFKIISSIARRLRQMFTTQPPPVSAPNTSKVTFRPNHGCSSNDQSTINKAFTEAQNVASSIPFDTETDWLKNCLVNDVFKEGVLVSCNSQSECNRSDKPCARGGLIEGNWYGIVFCTRSSPLNLCDNSGPSAQCLPARVLMLHEAIHVCQAKVGRSSKRIWPIIPEPGSSAGEFQATTWSGGAFAGRGCPP